MTLAITLLGLVPNIIQTIVAVEQAAAGASGAGADKQATVIAAVVTALETAAPDVLHKLGADKAADFVTKITNIVVSLANKIGAFSKKS